MEATRDRGARRKRSIVMDENPYQATVYERRPEERPTRARFRIGVWRRRMFVTLALSFVTFFVMSIILAILPMQWGIDDRQQFILREFAGAAIAVILCSSLLAWFTLSFWERLAGAPSVEAPREADLPPV